MSAKIGFLFGSKSKGKKVKQEHARCKFCDVKTAAPCTEVNYGRCGHYMTAVGKKLGPPRGPVFVDKHKLNVENCDCAACCEARARSTALVALSPAPLALPTQGPGGNIDFNSPAWRIRIAEERKQRKARKKAEKEARAAKNPQKAARLQASRGKPGSRKAKKHERRERYQRMASYSPSTLARPAAIVRAPVPKVEVNIPRREPTVSELNELVAMHTYRRPHKSESEAEFIKRFVWPACTAAPQRGVDEFGNMWAIIPHKEEDKPVRTMFCAHTDDVSYFAGRRGVRVDYGVLSVAKNDSSSCLGADDAAGVWMLIELIRANVPGVYCFFRDEEHGGIGSRYFREANKAHPRYMALDHCVAFDRFGYGSIITSQRGRRCASDTFALALGTALGLGQMPDATGVFTDTASFTDDVSECTNVSVGYKNQHSSAETQDLAFLCALRDAAVKVNWDMLPASRDPKAVITPWYSRRSREVVQPEVDQTPAYPRLGQNSQPTEAGEALRRAMGRGRLLSEMGDAANDEKEADAVADYLDAWHKCPRSMMALVEDYPEHIIALLEDMGYDAASLHKHIMETLDQL